MARRGECPWPLPMLRLVRSEGLGWVVSVSPWELLNMKNRHEEEKNI